MTTDNLETGGPAFPTSCDIRHMEVEGMTTRTYAAIKLRVPQSEHEFINDMIRESQRFELAKAAMQGLISQGSALEMRMVNQALETADAMLAEQEKK